MYRIVPQKKAWSATVTYAPSPSATASPTSTSAAASAGRCWWRGSAVESGAHRPFTLWLRDRTSTIASTTHSQYFHRGSAPCRWYSLPGV